MSMSCIEPEELQDESEIVWLIPQTDLPRHVFEWFGPLPTRDEPPPQAQVGDDYLVGYSVLRPDALADDEGFMRRWFTVGDPHYPEDVPMEVVDSATIAVGVSGEPLGT